MSLSKWNVLYGLLVFLRIILAFSPSYIHPDEWFQSGEALIAHLLQVNALKTWEFRPVYPCRSFASIYLFNLPMVIAIKLHLLDRSSSGYAFFAIQRFTFLILSFVSDLCMARYVGSALSKRQKQATLLLYAGSGAVLSFTCRPFSNNVESSILCVCLTIVCRLNLQEEEDSTKKRITRIACPDNQRWLFASACIGFFGAVGFFSRFTFSIFAFPIVLHFLRTTRKKAAGFQRPLLRWFLLLLPCFIAFVLTSLMHIAFDAYLYSILSETEIRESWEPFEIPVVPFNALKYNLQPSNLAEHGVHPRWLHAIVNAPMILGVIPYLSLLHRTSRHFGFLKDDTIEDGTSELESLLSQVIVFSSIVLSVQAHQEPRFLLPLIAPATLLCGIRFGKRKYSKTTNVVFCAASILQSVVMILLFSLTHQAGIISSILRFGISMRETMSGDSAIFLFWRTFMPPRHLLLPFLSSAFDEPNVMDLTDSSAERVMQIIEKGRDSSTFFNAPMWAIWKDLETFSHINITLDNALQSRWPHLDLDHTSECFNMWRDGYPLHLSFSYATWYLERL